MRPVVPLKPGERKGLETLLELMGGNIAKGHEHRIARMVVAAVKGHQVLMAQIRDAARLTPAVEMVGRGGKQVAAQGLPQGGYRRTHRPFHLIEHHPLEHQLGIRVVRLRELHPMPFLGKIQGVKTGEEGRVQIDIQQVEEVLAVLAGKGGKRSSRSW